MDRGRWKNETTTPSYHNYRYKNYMENGLADLKIRDQQKSIQKLNNNSILESGGGGTTFVSTINMKLPVNKTDSNVGQYIRPTKNPTTVSVRQYKRTQSDELNQNTKAPTTFLPSLQENDKRRITYNDKAHKTTNCYIGKPFYNVGNKNPSSFLFLFLFIKKEKGIKINYPF